LEPPSQRPPHLVTPPLKTSSTTGPHPRPLVASEVDRSTFGTIDKVIPWSSAITGDHQRVQTRGQAPTSRNVFERRHKVPESRKNTEVTFLQRFGTSCRTNSDTPAGSNTCAVETLRPAQLPWPQRWYLPVFIRYRCKVDVQSPASSYLRRQPCCNAQYPTRCKEQGFRTIRSYRRDSTSGSLRHVAPEGPFPP